MAFVLKTIFNNDTRRVLIDPVCGFKFRDLEALLVQQFPQAKKFRCSYIDDEGDQVTVTSDTELAEGFRLAQEMGWKSLKIVVGDNTAKQVKQAKQATVVPPSTKEAPKQEEPMVEEEPVATHWGFVCDASGQKPIIGPRYHKVGKNFDLCEAEFLKLPASEQCKFEKIVFPARGGWWRRFCRQQRDGARRGPPKGWRRHQQKAKWAQWKSSAAFDQDKVPAFRRCGGGSRRRWGCGGGRGGGNPLLRKAKKFFWVLRDSDIGPLLTALFEAGGAAAEACAPLKELAKAAQDDVAVRVVKRMRRSPAVQKLKQRLNAVHEDVTSGRIPFFEAPAALFRSEEWGAMVAQLRDALPTVAGAVEQMAALAPRLQKELPLLMPRLCPILMGMAFMGPPKKRAKPFAKPQRHQAKFVKDITVPDGSVLAPGASFTKTWTVSNSGQEAWPEDTALLHVGGDMELRPSVARIAVGTVGPNEEKQLSVDMTAPEKPGRFWSYWRLVADDHPAAQQFGLRLWADVTVEEPKEEEEGEPSAPPKDEGASKDCVEGDAAIKEAIRLSLDTDKEEPAPAVSMPMLGTATTTLADVQEPVATKLDSAEAREEPCAVPQQPPTPMLGTALATDAQEPNDPAVSHRQSLPVEMPGLGDGMKEAEACDETSDAATVPCESLAVAPEAQPPSEAADIGPWKSAVQTLVAMGFGPEQFQSLLKRHNGDIQAIMEELLQ